MLILVSTLYFIRKTTVREPDEEQGQYDANKKENALMFAKSGFRRDSTMPNNLSIYRDESALERNASTLSIIPRSSSCSVYRTPIPHKIYVEGEFDELHGEGHAGKERQEIVNIIYNKMQASKLS